MNLNLIIKNSLPRIPEANDIPALTLSQQHNAACSEDAFKMATSSEKALSDSGRRCQNNESYASENNNDRHGSLSS